MSNYQSLLHRCELFEQHGNALNQKGDELKQKGDELKRRFIDQFIISTKWDKQHEEWINHYTNWDILCNDQLVERTNQISERNELLKIVPRDTYLTHLEGRDHLANPIFDRLTQLSNELKQLAYELKLQAKWVNQLVAQLDEQAQTIKMLSTHLENLDKRLKQSDQFVKQLNELNTQIAEKDQIIIARTNLNKRLIDTLLIYKHKQPDGPTYDYQEIKYRKQKLHSEFKRLSKLMKLG